MGSFVVSFSEHSDAKKWKKSSVHVCLLLHFSWGGGWMGSFVVVSFSERSDTKKLRKSSVCP